MINGNIDVFLDTGWYSETTLFYNGFIYWLEAYTEKESSSFIVKKWKATITEDYLYHEYITNDGRLVDYEIVYRDTAPSMDQLKKKFFESEVFDGKTFWKAQDKIIWTEPGEPIKSDSMK